MSALVRIVVANPDNVARIGIRTLFSDYPDLELIGETAHSCEIQPLCERLSPDLLLLSTALPSSELIECIHKLGSQMPPLFILMLAADYDPTRVQAFIQAGIAGYVLVSDPVNALIQAIRTVMDGGTWFSQSVIRQLVQAKFQPLTQTEPSADPLWELTERERQVLELLTCGWTNQRIGHALGITERTIRFHVRNIFDKLNFKTRGEVFAWTIQREREKLDTPLLTKNG